LSNIELNLSSNTFSHNRAVNGGALYIEDGTNIDNTTNKTISIENNTFNENIAEDFGGAIYTNFNKLNLATTNDNSFSYNTAGIMGGGVYSSCLLNENIFNISNNKIINNTVNSHVENFSSKPKYISFNKEKSLNVTIGEYLPLSFTLLDTDNNIVNDYTKYYSITLKLILESKDIDNIPNYYMTGNIGSFIHGKKLSFIFN